MCRPQWTDKMTPQGCLWAVLPPAPSTPFMSLASLTPAAAWGLLHGQAARSAWGAGTSQQLLGPGLLTLDDFQLPLDNPGTHCSGARAVLTADGGAGAGAGQHPWGAAVGQEHRGSHRPALEGCFRPARHPGPFLFVAALPSFFGVKCFLSLLFYWL